MQTFSLCMISCDAKRCRLLCLCMSMCLRVKGRCTMGWWLWVTLWVRERPPSCPFSSGRSILHCSAILTPLLAASSGQCDLAVFPLLLFCTAFMDYAENCTPLRERVCSAGMMTLDKIHAQRLNWCVKGLVHTKMNILSLFLILIPLI